MAERVAPGGPPVGGPALSQRVLAPDLARGAMLLLIALANVHLYLYGHAVGIRGYPLVQSTADRIVTVVQMCLVDGRAYPMFAVLFGYGTVQLLRRQAAAGADRTRVRRLVRRRGWWMLLFGLVHAVLLFSGDIIGPYGLLAVIFAGLVVGARTRTLVVVAGLWMVVTTLIGGFMSVPLPAGTTSMLPSMATENPLVAAGIRVPEYVLLGSVTAFVLLVPALFLGVWAGRRRLLDEPDRHRVLLRRTAVAGIGVAVLGGLPSALMAAGLWSQASVMMSWLAGCLHTVSGYAGGLGFAAIAGLVAIRVGARRGPLVTALAACGQRSMTSYLLQSVVFVALLPAWTVGLGDDLGVVATALIAVVTWAATLVLAELMRRRGQRGPFEVLLRRLTYSVRPRAGDVRAPV